MSISVGAPNFTLAEFQNASDVALAPDIRLHAIWHANVMQRARNALNDFYGPPPVGGEWQIHITSFVRSQTTGDHKTGAAIDWNVRDKSGTRYDSRTRWARDWLALNEPLNFAELIYEPGFTEGAYAHVHQVRRGFSKDVAANVEPQILDEIEEGKFTVASIFPFPRPTTLSASILLVAAVVAYLIFQKA